jgi:beta-lactamase regulating signal transducer with metallopeptidase domain
MAYWGNSLFLQSLGWATLNSFWQMALLWCLFQLVTHFIKLSSNQKYLLAVYSVFAGFGWFALTGIIFYQNGLQQSPFSGLALEVSTSQLSIILSAASLTYLLLLVFPTYRITRNWLYLNKIKKGQLEKAEFRYRLFSQKIASHLGIIKPVKVYVSEWISSPLTIGFIKPLILLPVSAINNLTVQQLEAILLHELSHIKRQDYIINLVLSLMQTVLYFNPFLKLFMKRIEIERENCCDELVLQFEYDKHSYAAALLQLEKNSQTVPQLAMAAAQKNNLLHRIEKIVGVHRKPSFNTTHFAGAFAVLMMLMVINSVLIAGKEKIVEAPFTHFSEPFSFFTNNKNIEESGKDKSTSTASFLAKTDRFLPATLQKQGPLMSIIEPLNLFVETPPEPSNPGFLHVSYNEAEVALNADQKKQVGKTVEDTRKVLEKNWKEIEKSIGDDLTAEEKMMAKKEYMKEVEKIDWKKLEKNLKSQYETINWDELNNSLNQTLVLAEIDSIKEVYTQVAVELQKMKVSENCAKAAAVAMPDASVRQVEKAKAEVKERLEEINKIKAKKVIVKL